MLDWILKIFFGEKIKEIQNLHCEATARVADLKKRIMFAERNNQTCLVVEDVNSSGFINEISSIWNSNAFKYIVYLTRQELINEIVRGNDIAARNVQGMLKGIEALAIKMQEITNNKESV